MAGNQGAVLVTANTLLSSLVRSGVQNSCMFRGNNSLSGNKREFGVSLQPPELPEHNLNLGPLRRAGRD